MAEENNDKTKEQQNLENLLEKYGNDSLRLATNLLAENASLREKNRTLKASVPGEGSFILSKEEKTEWDTFKALNKPMTDIQKELSETETLRTENAKLVKRDSLREVAATGWKLGVLEEQLTKFPNAQVSVKKQKASDQFSRRKRHNQLHPAMQATRRRPVQPQVFLTVCVKKLNQQKQERLKR